MRAVLHFAQGLLCLWTMHAAEPWASALVERRPSFHYEGSDGCGDLLLYGWNRDRSELISVAIDRQRARLSNGTSILKLGTAPYVTINIYTFDSSVRSLPFCTDLWSSILSDANSWRPISGEVKVWINRPLLGGGYDVRIELRHLTLVSDAQNSTPLKTRGVIKLSARVGTLPG